MLRRVVRPAAPPKSNGPVRHARRAGLQGACSASRGCQAALKCSYRSDSLTREYPSALRVRAARAETRGTAAAAWADAPNRACGVLFLFLLVGGTRSRSCASAHGPSSSFGLRCFPRYLSQRASFRHRLLLLLFC